MHTIDELRTLQKMPLEWKIIITEDRIHEWVYRFGKNYVYVSFSGGKDSTVLLHIVRRLYPDIEAVFVNTGLEYLEIQKFVNLFDNVTILRPKMRYDEVIRKYGYPFISKEVGECVYNARFSKSDNYRMSRLKKLNGDLFDNNGNKSRFSLEKYKPLLDVDFSISNQCCNVMKKRPVHLYCSHTGKFPITAQTAAESQLRLQQWLKNGCNGFDLRRPVSNPMSFWTEQDILQYILQNKLPIASVYGDIVYVNGYDEYSNLLCDNGCNLKCTGCQRTGCIFCGFGVHLEKGENRFERLKRTHPTQYEYCMGGGAYDTDGFWKPNEKGLGMKHCIDVLNGIYGKDFIKF